MKQSTAILPHCSVVLVLLLSTVNIFGTVVVAWNSAMVAYRYNANQCHHQLSGLPSLTRLPLTPLRAASANCAAPTMGAVGSQTALRMLRSSNDDDGSDNDDFAENEGESPLSPVPQNRHNTRHLPEESEILGDEEDASPSSQTLESLQRNITATVDQKIRVAQAQAEIDRILKGPDAPFDTETELKKVKSIAPPVAESLLAQELDEKASQMEQDLYQAVKQQDYGKAATLKQEISQAHIDDCGAVLQVNAAFYRAFSEKNLGAMEALWLHDGTSTCIHPSHKPLVGSKAVLHSWKRMFRSSDGSFQRNWMEPHDIRLTVKGASTAIVTCDEHVYARRFVRGQKRQTELINKLTATNIFRKVNGRWMLTYHHASWHADSEAAKNALRGGGAGGATLRSGNSKARKSARSSRSNQEDDNDDDASIGMDGILGMNDFGPLLGSSHDKKGEGDKKPVKRIVMGSLSDIFNGNLGDILGNDESNDGNGDDANNESGAIIRFSRIDDDDEDDDDDDHDEEDEEGSETVSIIKKWGDSTETEGSGSSNKGSNGEGSEPKDALRQNCITALRKLCDQGSISPKQKRVLLTDIITCSAKGEFSMVEVAYELLCGEGEDKEVAEEEFADQCRVFAHSLPESPVQQS